MQFTGRPRDPASYQELIGEVLRVNGAIPGSQDLSLHKHNSLGEEEIVSNNTTH